MTMRCFLSYKFFGLALLAVMFVTACSDPDAVDMYGTKLGDCASEREFAGTCAGCRVCGAMPTAAEAPDGSCWRFSTTCTPDSFTASTRCNNAFYADACHTGPTIILGRPYDDVQDCYLPVTEAGSCTNCDACGDAITTSQSPDGTCWKFSNTCVPNSFPGKSCDVATNAPNCQ